MTFRLRPIPFAALILFVCISAAVAQVIVPPAPNSIITVGEVVNPWLTMLITIVGVVVMALFGWLARVMIVKAGLEGNAAVALIETQLRETLQSALLNGAGRIAVTLGDKLNTIQLDVKSPAIKQGILVVNQGAAEAVAKFGLTPEKIGEMLINKLGVVTAPNPSVNPVATAPVTPPVVPPAAPPV